ncbi:PREDICTED: uncharacterized protein LOC104747845 isoform X1 [Camelina sativa]|uniref:Uncharacterized protein LOC104747845 isoform X1 n=1 Tax=Camelina sativa TaxID=90675 RepID=A0ABM0WA07_CAMSA|nr:PREDICTED: uncharacterized protein LOC104747845 isoform X1 [Camelina sativa]
MEVDVPVSVAYNFYLDRESFPKWMPFISSVEVLKDKPDLSRWSLKYDAFGQDSRSIDYGSFEFVKAASLDNEIQFVETTSSDVAKLLFPDLKTNNVFVGLVKTEAERYTAYAESKQNIFQRQP